MNNFFAAAARADRFGRWTGLVNTVLFALGGSIAMAIAAHVKIPFWPVPMTMQVLVVLMVGWIGGRNLAALSMGLYIAQGAIGLPVFSGGAGLAYLAGPTAGYIVGFFLAAVFLGEVRDRVGLPGAGGIAAANLCAVALIYGPGWIWLSVIMGSGMAAFSAGVLPFLLSDVLKIGIATAAVMILAGRNREKPMDR